MLCITQPRGNANQTTARYPHTCPKGENQRQRVSVGGAVGKWILVPCCWDCKLAQLLWKTVWGFLRKSELQYDPAIPLPGIWRKWSHAPWKHICAPTFTAPLFTTPKTWNRPKYPPADEWIKKRWYVYLAEYYSATKKEIVPFVTTWMGLKSIMLREIKSGRKTTTVWPHFYVDS